MDKVQHAFYCGEDLWQAFLGMACLRGCEIDELISEAMSAYLADSGMGVGDAPAANTQVVPNQIGMPVGQPVVPPPAPMPPVPQVMAPPPAPMLPVPQVMAPPPAPMPPVPQVMAPPPASMPPVAPIRNNISQIGASASTIPLLSPVIPSGRPPQVIAPPPVAEPRVPAPAAVPAPSAVSPLGGGQKGLPPLYIVFAGQRYLVDKEKFIVGRSSQVADLVIRDGNISRKHCAIIYKGGVYYIKDLNSTNGIEYKGVRIDAKRIDEGDKFNVCEFEFSFTYG